jgi:competence protein ComEC
VEFSDFDYAKYLSIQNIGAQCFRPEVSVVPHLMRDPIAWIPAGVYAGSAGAGMTVEAGMTQILKAKNFLIEKINLTLHEPFASFLGGLLLGARNSIPESLSQNFKNTGTAHIVAISGWNITFLAQLFMPVLFVFRVRRQKAFYLMSGAIFIYALFTGFSPSVLRAAIMGSVALYAQKSGRLNSAGRGLLYSASLMFLINPRLIYDAGFWLSAVATFGLIYFSGIAQNFFYKIPKGIMRENLATTVSAIIFTLPVSLYIFGTVSLWALPVNLIILPFVAVAIPLSLPAVFVSALPNGILVAQVLFLPAVALLDFIVKVINFFGSLHFGIWQVKINFWLMLAIYFTLVVFVIKKVKEQNERF